MKKFIAEGAIATLGLRDTNNSFANYWLSLWEGDELPGRSKFSPGKIKPLLPFLLVFDVVPDESVTVRLAGTGFRYILGEDITGKDWLAMTRAHHRPTRLGNLSAVARGSVMKAQRRIKMVVGEDRINEEIVLPFAPEKGGTCQVVAHAEWGVDPLTKAADIRNIEDDTRDFRLLPIT
ncbi:MAG: PAS domain-containing protein [Candidatus Angelobacter sp.]